jgi:hypothetical protein
MGHRQIGKSFPDRSQVGRFRRILGVVGVGAEDRWLATSSGSRQTEHWALWEAISGAAARAGGAMGGISTKNPSPVTVTIASRPGLLFVRKFCISSSPLKTRD